MINEYLLELYNGDAYQLEDKVSKKNSERDVEYINSKIDSLLFESILEKFKVNLHYKVLEHFKKKYSHTLSSIPISISDGKIHLYDKDIVIHEFENKTNNSTSEEFLEELYGNATNILEKTIFSMEPRILSYIKNLERIKELLEEMREISIEEFNLEYEPFSKFDKYPILSPELYTNGSYYALSLFGERVPLRDISQKEPRLFEHREYSENELRVIVSNAVEEVKSKAKKNYSSTLLKKVKKELLEKHGLTEFELSILQVSSAEKATGTMNFQNVEIPLKTKPADIGTIARYVKIVNIIKSSTKEVRKVFNHLFMIDGLDPKIKGISMLHTITVGDIIENIKDIKDKIYKIERAVKYSVYPEDLEAFYYSKSFFMNYEGTFEHNGKVYIRMNYRLPGCMKTKILAFEGNKNKDGAVTRISTNKFFKKVRSYKKEGQL